MNRAFFSRGATLAASYRITIATTSAIDHNLSTTLWSAVWCLAFSCDGASYRITLVLVQVLVLVLSINNIVISCVMCGFIVRCMLSQLALQYNTNQNLRSSVWKVFAAKSFTFQLLKQEWWWQKPLKSCPKQFKTKFDMQFKNKTIQVTIFELSCLLCCSNSLHCCSTRKVWQCCTGVLIRCKSNAWRDVALFKHREVPY